MAQYRGYSCDMCGHVISSEEVTEVTVRVDGPVLSGEFDQDLCPECAPKRIPDGVAMRPLRRRNPRATQAVATG